MIRVLFSVESSNRDFDCYRKSAEIAENDLEKHVSEIQMKLVAGENYTLIGVFTNNFWCEAEAKHNFFFSDAIIVDSAVKAHKKSDFVVNVNIIIFALIGVVILMVILKFKDIVRCKAKVLNFIIPGRRGNQHLVALRYVVFSSYPTLSFRLSVCLSVRRLC